MEPSGSKPNWVAISPSTVLLDKLDVCAHRQNKFWRIVEYVFVTSIIFSIVKLKVDKNGYSDGTRQSD